MSKKRRTESERGREKGPERRELGQRYRGEDRVKQERGGAKRKRQNFRAV